MYQPIALPPPFPVEAEHDEYAYGQPGIVNGGTQGVSLFKKHVSETDAEQGIDQHPDHDGGQTPNNFF